MNSYKLSNIPLSTFRDYLAYEGWSKSEQNRGGGHEKWIKTGSLRPVILQTHIDPVPEFIIKSNLRTMGVSRKDFLEWLRNK